MKRILLIGTLIALAHSLDLRIVYRERVRHITVPSGGTGADIYNAAYYATSNIHSDSWTVFRRRFLRYGDSNIYYDTSLEGIPDWATIHIEPCAWDNSTCIEEVKFCQKVEDCGYHSFIDLTGIVGPRGEAGPPGPQGIQGEAGTSCLVDQDDDCYTITCGDVEVGRLCNGQDAYSCEVSNKEDGCVIITCPQLDGSSQTVTICDGKSCTATETEQGTVIDCDGSSVEIPYPESCTVRREEGDLGKVVVECPNSGPVDIYDGESCVVSKVGTVTTIVCGDDTAEVNDGESCTATRMDGSPGRVEISCPGTGTVNIYDGEDGEHCRISSTEDSGRKSVTITCRDDEGGEVSEVVSDGLDGRSCTVDSSTGLEDGRLCYTITCSLPGSPDTSSLVCDGASGSSLAYTFIEFYEGASLSYDGTITNVLNLIPYFDVIRDEYHYLDAPSLKIKRTGSYEIRLVLVTDGELVSDVDMLVTNSGGDELYSIPEYKLLELSIGQLHRYTFSMAVTIDSTKTDYNWNVFIGHDGSTPVDTTIKARSYLAVRQLPST